MSLADWPGPSPDDPVKPPAGTRTRSHSALRRVSKEEGAGKADEAKKFFEEARLANLRRKSREDVDSVLRDARERRERQNSLSRPGSVEESRTPSKDQESPRSADSSEVSSAPQRKGLPGMPPGWSTVPSVPGMPHGWDKKENSLTEGVEHVAQAGRASMRTNKAKIGFSVRVGEGNLLQRLRDGKRRQTVG